MANKKFITTFQKTVATSGTPVQLHSDLPIPDGFMLVIKALQGNAGFIYVGPTQDNLSSSSGFELDAGESVGVKVENANQIWLDTSSDGDSVSCLVEGGLGR